MPTSLDFHRASLSVFTTILSKKSEAQKGKFVSIQIAEQFNRIVDNIKAEYPDAAPHLPAEITAEGIAADDMKIADIRYLDFELLVNQVLATLEVIHGEG